MNVMNRKLFANRDARRRLANMGGIVASSPELLGTAQRFQNGGTVPSRRSDTKFFEQEVRPLLRSRGPNTVRGAELFNDARNAQFSRELEKVLDLIRFYSKSDPDYAKLLEEKYAPYLNRKADELDALFKIQSGDVDEIDRDELQALLPQMDSPASYFSIVSPQEPTENYPTYSRQSDKGFASTYQQPNVELTSSPILNQESEISTQNNLSEFEKIRQGMDAVPKAGQSVEPTVVKVKTVRIGDPLGGTNYDLYSDGSAVMLSTGRKIDPNNASAQPLLEMLQDLPDVSDTSGMSQPPVVEEPVLDSAPITEDERGILSKIVDFVKDDFSNFPKLPDSRKAKDELVRGKIADRIRNEGIFSGSNVQDTPKDTEGFATVTLNQGTTGMAVFDYNPETGEVIPRGTNAELMYSGSNKAQANVQNMVQEQYNLDFNIKPVVEAEKETAITQKMFDSNPTGKNLDLASEAKKKELEVKKETTTKKPSEVDKVLSRTTPFVDPPPVMDEIEEEFLKRREEERKDETQRTEEFREKEAEIADAQGKPEVGGKELEKIAKKVGKENEKDGDPVAAASSGILDTAGVDTSNMGRKERVESMKAMLSDLLGYDDEDQKEEFWLTMASIGFGIAAGQDSNALTNIAQGLAEGSSKLMENKATRQAREDKLTLTAFGEVLADERATTSFNRDLQIAKIRAGASSTDKYTAERERSRIKELIYKSPIDYPGLLDNEGNLDPSKVNTYLDQVIEIADAEPVVMTEETARAQAVNAIKARPDLKEVILKRLEEKGYSTEGL